MNALRFKVRQQYRRFERVIWVVAIAAFTVLAGGQAGVMAARSLRAPQGEFGLGPRLSASKAYLAMLLIDEPVQAREMQAMQVVITDRDGHPVDGATIGIDGGMPQERRGLPSRPRISKASSSGTYQIDGLRFDRGGWWELKVLISSAHGADVITFNLAVPGATKWSDEEVAQIRDLWIGSLEPKPADPSNKYADDPRAAALGRKLFFDTRFSSNGEVSCATCHKPELQFQDGTALAKGVGTTNRRTMPVAGTAYAPFLFWDGRKDSLWAQALGPLESPVEHGGNRRQYAALMSAHYKDEYESIFGAMPAPSSTDAVTRVFVNMGKAIAAYERRIDVAPAPFDRYAEGLIETGVAPAGIIDADAAAGLKLFIGRAQCTQCHNGPLLTNNEFHNTGVPAIAGLPPDSGRFAGSREVLADEFNCRSRWSDAPPAACTELDVMPVSSHDQQRAFKVPSLRDVADRAPYMHAGQFATLADALAHYNRAPAGAHGHSELTPLKLNARELRQLEAFLRTLSGGVRER
jgi:cytochrome c peroxidase